MNTIFAKMNILNERSGNKLNNTIKRKNHETSSHEEKVLVQNRWET